MFACYTLKFQTYEDKNNEMKWEFAPLKEKNQERKTVRIRKRHLCSLSNLSFYRIFIYYFVISFFFVVVDHYVPMVHMRRNNYEFFFCLFVCYAIIFFVLKHLFILYVIFSFHLKNKMMLIRWHHHWTGIRRICTVCCTSKCYTRTWTSSILPAANIMLGLSKSARITDHIFSTAHCRTATNGTAK